MSEGIFWRPGDSRPTRSRPSSRGRKDVPKDSSASRPLHGPSLPASPPVQTDHTQAKSEDTPARKTKLSGATMNMRFMMRKQHSPAAPVTTIAATASKASSSLSAGRSEGPSDVEQSAQPQHHESQVEPSAGDEPIFMNILGRRSFGGFNRHAETAWMEHASFHGSVTHRSKSRRKDTAEISSSDKEKKRKRHSR